MFGFGRKKEPVERDHLERLEFFFLGDNENRHMDPDPVAAIALDRPAQQRWQRTPLPPRLPREAEQLGVRPRTRLRKSGTAERAPAAGASASALAADMPARSAGRVHHSPPQQPALDPASRLATLPKGQRSRGLAQVYLLPLNPSPPWAMRGTSFSWLIGFDSPRQHRRSSSFG